MKKLLLDAMRSSEFWALAAQAVVEALHAPVPDEVKVVGWVYIVLCAASKLAKFVLPNPNSSTGRWFGSD